MGLALIAPSGAAAQDPSVCAPFAQQWDTIRRTSDHTAMEQFQRQVPNECADLRDAIRTRLASLAGTGPSRGVVEPPPPVTSPNTPTPPPSSETAPSVTDSSALPGSAISISDQLIAGEATFNKPSRMNFSDEATIEVQINLAEQDAPSTIGTAGDTVTRQVAIAREVEAQLLSPDFDIEPLAESGTLAITDQSIGRWAWIIRPRRSGEDLRLELRIYGLVQLPGQTPSRALIKLYDERIDVIVTPRDRFNQALAWTTSNWAMASGIVGALFAGLVFLFRRRRRKPPSP